MATKDYTKGMAQLAFKVERYIAKYNLDSGPVTAPWTTTLQSAAAAMSTAAKTIDATIPFREQP